MSSLDFGWMLDPRLQQRGMISPQTAALAQQRGVIPQQGNVVGGYRPPMSPLEQYMAQISAPPKPAAFPPDHPAAGLRASMVQAKAAPQGPDLAFGGEPVSAERPQSFTQRLLAETETKTARRGIAGAGPIAQMREGAQTQQAGIVAEGAVQAEEAEAKGKMYGDAIAEARKHENTYASIARRRGMAEKIAQKNMQSVHEEAAMMEKYPAISPEQARHYQSVIDSPSTTPEQKMRSQAALKKAGEIDPERVYGGSTGRKVMAAIGMALGAYGAALAKTPNYAMQIVQSAIDNDIAAQRERFASQRESAKEKRAEAATDYERIRTKFADELSQTEALEAVHWRRFGRLLEQTSVKYAAPEAKAKAMQMYGQSQAIAAEKEANIRARQSELEMERMKVEAATQPKQLAAPIDIEPIGPVDENAVKEARPLVQGYTRAKGAVASVRALRQKYGAEFTDQSAIRDGQAMAKEWVKALKKMEQFGAALTENEEALISMVDKSDPSKIGFVLEQIDASEKALDMSMSAQLRGLNFRLKGGTTEDTAQEIGFEAH